MDYSVMVLLAAVIAFLVWRIRYDGVRAVLARLISLEALIVWVLLAVFGWLALTPRAPSIAVVGAGVAFVIALLIMVLMRASNR